MSPDSNLPWLRVRHLPGEYFQQRCQAYRVQASGGSVDFGAFYSGAKLPPVLFDRYLNSELYRGILWYTSAPFAKQHFRDNYRYKEVNATPHRAWIVIDFIQQDNVTKMEQWQDSQTATR